MYEHPYFTYRLSAIEIEQVTQAAERRRMIAENPSRIVQRDGLLLRILHRLLRVRPAHRSAAAEAPGATGARCVALEA